MRPIRGGAAAAEKIGLDELRILSCRGGYASSMSKTTTHRLVFTRDRSLRLGDALPSGQRDDQGARLPLGGRCMVDSILHLQAVGQYVVSVSHYPAVA
jgi:hypothetical protein